MPIRILPKTNKQKHNKWTDPEYKKHVNPDKPKGIGTPKYKRGKFRTTKGKGTKDLRDRLKEITSRTRPSINERLGGGVEGKPHSTKEGRTAAGKRRIKRLFSKEATRPRPGRPLPRPSPGWKRPENIMTPLRAKHGVGSIVKKIITKIKPKPKGKGLGSGVKPSEMHEIIPKKDRKLYLKEKLANPHLMKLRNKESKKVFKSAKGKAEGGRIGLKDGGSPHTKDRQRPPRKKFITGYGSEGTSRRAVEGVKRGHATGGRIGLKHGSAQSHYTQHGYGPHKIQLRSGKPKIAKKGW